MRNKRYKDSGEIQDLLTNRFFIDDLDCNLKTMLFCKDTHYNGEQFNKNSLIMITEDNYVINNDMRFNSLEVEEHDDYDIFKFHSIYNPKKTNKTSVLEYYIEKYNPNKNS